MVIINGMSKMASPLCSNFSHLLLTVYVVCTKLNCTLWTYFVPKLNIETEINVEILMMVVMKDAVRLPGLPPMSLECNARVVNYAMVISIQQYGHERNYKEDKKIISFFRCH